MCPIFYRWAHCDHIGVIIQNGGDLQLVGTFWSQWKQIFRMCPIFNHWTHCGPIAENIQNVPNF